MDININNTSNTETTQPNANPQNISDVNSNNSMIDNNSEKIDYRAKGLNDNEYKDPNAIRVTITDETTPIVILFGPPSCGKTMSLIRLARYIRKYNYTITPARTFRPSNDTHYTNLCDNFDVMINSEYAADSTTNISFMLVNVSKNGRTICQILEAPGEYYFNHKSPKTQFPAFVNKIISGKNRKIWAVMVEPDWKDESDRKNYVQKIADLQRKINQQDKTIFIFNKIDLAPEILINQGTVHTSSAIKKISDLYPGIFEPFRNNNPITKLWNEWRCDFVPFQTGDYNKTNNDSFCFTEGPDIYPQKLWETILNRIKG